MPVAKLDLPLQLLFTIAKIQTENPMLAKRTLPSFLLILVLVPLSAAAHDGPDPISHWMLNQKSINGTTLQARLGPNGVIEGETELVQDPMGESMRFFGPKTGVLLARDFKDAKQFLPEGPFTVSAWVSVERRRQWGSVLSVIQDNGSAESGWILGYSNRNFYFGLSTQGADDGDGKMTYLNGDTEYELGRLYHVTAVYDGKTMLLYVNGKLDGSSREQNGPILYPESAPYCIGVYRDDDENHPHHGRIRDVAVYDLAARGKWVAKQFKQSERLASLEPNTNIKFELRVPPYLQMATKDSIVVSWETTRPSSTKVSYGETNKVEKSASGPDKKLIHHVTLEGLKPNTQYFYRAVSTSGEEKITAEVLTFQTAPNFDTPYAFAVISDTQGNPKVSSQIAKLAWAQRPSFLIHPGDLVSTGTDDTHWTDQFFPSMHELIGRVPMYPVLGNHELNAGNYYDYMVLPAPEYFYEFNYGNAHFFMIDSNKKVAPGSEQFIWLDKALSISKAKWKFVVHHHPPFSSDENDYGDLWKSNRSTRGDARVRKLTQLYDEHGVDIVFNGHIHSYERTWPLKSGEPVAAGKGTIYMITGGGGGHLETPGPFRPKFQNNVKRGHHYSMVHVNGGELELKSFDLEGRLFDTMKLVK